MALEPLLRPLLWIACLMPAALLAWRAWSNDLGVNPIEEVTHTTGTTALVLLLVTLTVTPLRHVTGWNRAARLRRPLGLFAFFYATLHLATYVALDQFFAFEYILDDLRERPYIMAGMAAFALMVPLALTSTRGWIRRLGRGWQRLHRLVYASALFAVLHYIWLVKADLRRPLVFAGVLALLLVLRLPPVRRAMVRLRRGGRAAQVSAER